MYDQRCNGHLAPMVVTEGSVAKPLLDDYTIIFGFVKDLSYFGPSMTLLPSHIGQFCSNIQ
jgi:hypothetical protein